MPVTFVEKKQANSINKRPPFGQWIKYTWLNILMVIILCCAALALSQVFVYEEQQAQEMQQPPQGLPQELPQEPPQEPLQQPPQAQQEGLLDLSHLIRDIVSPVAPVLLSTIVILLSQIFVKSFWDANNAILGLFSSITAAWCFANVVNSLNRLFSKTLYDEVAIMEFPGTQSTFNFACLVFLSLYLNAKLKICANYCSSLLKLAIVCLPLLLAAMSPLVEIDSEISTWFSSMIGVLFGTLFAMATYRMFYVSVFDGKVNHIPLSPMMPYNSETQNEYRSEFKDAMISRTCKRASYERPRAQPVWNQWSTQYTPQICTRCAQTQALPTGEHGMPGAIGNTLPHDLLTGDGAGVERRGSDSEHGSEHGSGASVRVIREHVSDATERSEGNLSVINERVTEGEENV